MSLLIHPTSGELHARLRDPDAQAFLDALQARLVNSPGSTLAKENPMDTDSTERLPADTLLEAVADARAAFRRKARGVRVALGVMHIVKDIALGRPADRGGQAGAEGLEILPAVLHGRLSKDVRYLGMAVK